MLCGIRTGVWRLLPWLVLPALLACGDDREAGEPVADNRPRVTVTVPEDGATVDASLTELSVTFDRPMMDGSWSWVIETGQPFPEVTGDPAYVNDTTNVLPVTVEPATSYVVWINSPDNATLRSFKSVEGVPADATRIRFSTQ